MSIQTVVKNLSATLDANTGDTAKAEVILASALTVCLPVPAESNGANGRTYYNSNHLDYVKRIVNAVNEEFLVDVQCVMKLVADLYTARFNIVHEANTSLDAFQALACWAYCNNHDDGTVMPEFTSSELKAVVTGLCGIDD